MPVKSPVLTTVMANRLVSRRGQLNFRWKQGSSLETQQEQSHL